MSVEKTKCVAAGICRVAAFAVAMAAGAQADAAAALCDADFVSPPREARSFSWWHWQEGFLNAGQMERELAFMREAGLGGCQQFVAGFTRVPTKGEHLVTFMTDEWLGFSRRALYAAATNGLEYGFQNGAGWTGVGGPWMTRDKSMKHIFAVERRTRGGAAVTLPPLGDGQYRLGPVANDRQNPWYGDIRSFAFPTPPAFAEGELPPPRVSGGGKRVRFDWDRTVTVRALRTTGNESAESAELWASEDGTAFRLVARLPGGVSSFQDMNAPHEQALPKTACRAIELRRQDAYAMSTNGIAFSTRPAFTGFDGQCGRGTWKPLAARTPPEEAAANLDPKEIRDITDRIAPDGSLKFTPPDARDWTVLRIAATSTRRKNDPAYGDMSGPACDILDADVTRFHLAQYFDRMLAVEKELGVRTIGNLLLDSWEQGTANWTRTLPEEFRTRRGYDLTTFLPVFGGYFVGSRETSERFLWDFRKTVNELVRDNFFGVIEDHCHARGLQHYVEGFACGVGTFACDPLMAYFACDVPMTEAGPTTREASSAAHLKGTKLVAVEAHTSHATWHRTPRDFKAREDAHFRHGITRLVYHGGAHNPKAEWRFPGLTFACYGAEIPPGQTWARYMRVWQDYLARCQYMLRRGAFVADALAFVGEDYCGPVVGVYSPEGIPNAPCMRDRLKGLPSGLDYDLVNAAFLKNLSVFPDGSIGLAGNPEATRYRVLVLRAEDSSVSVEVARELKRLVAAGATVVGPQPVRSLGHPNDGAEADAEVAAAGRALAASGRLFRTLDALALKPDFVARGAKVDEDVQYLHRREGETEIYYVIRWNRLDADARIGFHVTGKVPEIFDPLTGQIAEATDYEMKDGYTYLPAIPCDAAEATRFVVFRKPTDRLSRVAPPLKTTLAALEPDWTIRFKDELGVDRTIVTNRLFDWTTHADPAIATFSGTAVYKATVRLPPNPQPSTLKLCLGRVEELAEVLVDGTSCGVAWCEPYEVDITGAVKGKSEAELEIRLVNSWHNRLLADQKRPASERKTFTVLPPKADEKPVPSGLIGPVRYEVDRP